MTDLKAIYREVQKRKDEVRAELLANPEETARLAQKFYGPVAEQLPDVLTEPALAHTLEGMAWISRMLTEAGFSGEETEELFDVVGRIEHNSRTHLTQMGGVMTPAQGVSAGIGAGFFTGFWMGLLAKESREADEEVDDGADAA